MSLAGALQEYLDDPNFEQSQIEYRANKEATERGNGKKTNGTNPSCKSVMKFFTKTYICVL